MKKKGIYVVLTIVGIGAIVFAIYKMTQKKATPPYNPAAGYNPDTTDNGNDDSSNSAGSHTTASVDMSTYSGPVISKKVII